MPELTVLEIFPQELKNDTLIVREECLRPSLRVCAFLLLPGGLHQRCSQNLVPINLQHQDLGLIHTHLGHKPRLDEHEEVPDSSEFLHKSISVVALSQEWEKNLGHGSLCMYVFRNFRKSPRAKQPDLHYCIKTSRLLLLHLPHVLQAEHGKVHFH